MRILIRHKGCLRKFVLVESSGRDGSLFLVIRRNGASSSRVSWCGMPEKTRPKQIYFEQPCSKNKRITIHQTGRVNYHENGSYIFIEPLTRTTKNTCIYGYRVPALDRLDLHLEELNNEDVIFDLSDFGDVPLSFSVFIGPSSLAPSGKAVKLSYHEEGYSLIVAVDDELLSAPSGYENYFITVTAERGIFLHQQLTEDQAMIFYHQAITHSEGCVLYKPNGEGFIRLIFSVPMRIAPKFRIEFVNVELYVADQDVQRDNRSEKVMLRFRIRNHRTNQIIRDEVAIKSIELDEEL